MNNKVHYLTARQYTEKRIAKLAVTIRREICNFIKFLSVFMISKLLCMLFHSKIEELENSAQQVINRQTSIISRREHQNLENIYVSAERYS